MRFRNRVRETRNQRRLSVAALARLSDVSTETIFSLERDENYAPRVGVMLKLCQALNETNLFWIEREPSEPPPDTGV